MYGILKLFQGSHLNNSPLKTLNLGWVAFHSVAFQLKCLDFQCTGNQYKTFLPVLSRFCNGLFLSQGSSRWTPTFSISLFLAICSNSCAVWIWPELNSHSLEFSIFKKLSNLLYMYVAIKNLKQRKATIHCLSQKWTWMWSFILATFKMNYYSISMYL